MISNSVRAAGRGRGRPHWRLLRRGLLAAMIGCPAALVAVAGPAHAATDIDPDWSPPGVNCPQCNSGTYGYPAYADPAGDAQPGQQMQLMLSGTVQGKPAAGGTLYLSAKLIGHGAAATIGGSPLSPTPRPFSLNSAGQLTVIYQVADVQPGPAGIDVLTAADTASGSGAVTISYNYDRPTSYVLSPVPVAPTGSLAVGQTATAQLTALDEEGNPVAGALVADSGDDTCGTWYPWWPFPWPPRGPSLNGASDPSYAYTDPAGQLNFTFTLNSSTGAVSAVSAAGVYPATSPVTTFYQP